MKSINSPYINRQGIDKLSIESHQVVNAAECSNIFIIYLFTYVLLNYNKFLLKYCNCTSNIIMICPARCLRRITRVLILQLPPNKRVFEYNSIVDITKALQRIISSTSPNQTSTQSIKLHSNYHKHIPYVMTPHSELDYSSPQKPSLPPLPRSLLCYDAT